MKYFYYILCFITVLGGLYTALGIGNFHLVYHKAENPKGTFQILKGTNKELTLIDFTNYRCSGCRELYPTLVELRELRKDITYIVRPIKLPTNPQAENLQAPAPLENLALAAGLQGKFEEFHGLFMQYPEPLIPEEIIEQNAMLYGVDYEQLIKDAKSERVQKLLSNNNKDMNALSIRIIPSYIIGKNIYSIGEDLPDLKDMLNIIPLEK